MTTSIGIITLNARFIHSSLSLRYLRNAARRAGYENVWIQEFTINQPLWKIAAEIQQQKPQILGVSIYIWNRTQSFELIELLKKQNPNLAIVIGGPEVSFEKKISAATTTIAGEGETKWVECLESLIKGETPSEETLQRWRTSGNDLPELHPPYIEEDYPDLKNRYAYLETSRGCPYLCSFCLSALDKKVRYFEEDSLRRQIKKLIRSGVQKIKFVDRTFNLQPKRMRSLMEWLTQFSETEFHFEVVGDLIGDDMLAFLETVPQGMFQFEIGVQTTTEKVQDAIQRKQNNQKLFAIIANLVRQDRIHLHCDLIFGLPGETLEQILESFTEVFLLRPHELQLGFLKFLPGAPINDLIEQHEYQYLSSPPYEVISHKSLSAGKITWLKRFEEVFDMYYNSKRFKFSIERLLDHKTPVQIFQELMDYLDARFASRDGLSLDTQYRVFLQTFEIASDPMALDLLKLDYLYHQRVYRVPEFLQSRKTGRVRTWSGDRKTPVIPFDHLLELEGFSVHLSPTPSPTFYAIAHPEMKGGYFTRPKIERVASS